MLDATDCKLLDALQKKACSASRDGLWRLQLEAGGRRAFAYLKGM